MVNTFDEATEILAHHGIEVGRGGKLVADPSIHLFEDGHLYDFGRGGVRYRDAHELIERRPDLVGGEPVSANRKAKPSREKEWTSEYLFNEYRGLRHGLRDMVRILDVGNTHLLTHLSELLPKEWWDIDNLPECLGFDMKQMTLTVSVFNEDRSIAANTFRRVDDIKWLTHGTKRPPAMRLTGKGRVYFASGMGEALMLEILGVDYIVIQSDSVVKHLPEVEIAELVILPDNDESFRKIIPFVVGRLRPARAFVVEWEYTDPREAAIALVTRSRFIEEVEEHLVELEVPEPASEKGDSDIKFIEEYEPTKEDAAFADRFKEIAETEWGWSPPKGLYENWKILHRVFDDALNGIGKTQTVTIGAGEGKSRGTALYTATEIVRQGKSALIVVNLLSNGYEMAKDIDRWSQPGSARVLDSKKEDFDPESAPVLIITHKRLQLALHKKGRRGLDELLIRDGSQRNLVVIDEAIDLKATHTVSVRDLEHLISSSRFISKKECEAELKTIAWFSQLVADSIGGGPKIFDMEELPNGLVSQLPRVRNALNEKTKGQPDPYMGRRWDEVIDDIEALLISRHYRVSTGSLTYVSTAEDFMPKGASPVILDASADVDHIYREYEKQGLVRIVKMKSVRNFKGSTIYFLPAETSKSAMLKREDVIAGIQREVAESTGSQDNVLIVTHKDVKAELDTLTWNHVASGKPMIMNWGDITGRNDAKTCNVVFIFGLPHKPRYVDLDKSFAINDTVEDRELEGKYRTSGIVAEVYQAIMRSVLRVPQADGGCVPTRIYVTVPDQQGGASAQLRKAIEEILPTKLPGVEVKEWVPSISDFEDAIGMREGYLCKIPGQAQKLTPSQRKLLKLISEPLTMERLMQKSQYPGIVERKQIEKRLKITGRNTFPRMMKPDLIEECRLQGWYYDRWVVLNPKRPDRPKKIQGFVSAENIDDQISIAEFKKREKASGIE